MSPIRQPQLRNFAADPRTFTDSYTAQDGIGTDDFTLSVDFTLLEKGVHGIINIGCMLCVYYNSTKGYQPSVRILKSDGTKDNLYPVGSSHMTKNVASINVIKTGQNVRMVVYARDGSIVRDMTTPLPDGATVTSWPGVTTYPGSISAASIRNDTTGETVWQAAYSDLYGTSNPWPSPVPRNFASAEWRWYNAVNPILSLGTDDLEFYIQYRLDGYRDSSEINSLFYFNSQNGSINLAFQGDGTASNYSYIKLNGVADYVIPLDLIKKLGTHSIRIRRTGTTVTTEFDGTVLAELTASEITATTAGIYPITRFDGVIYDCYWKNLRTNRKVWQYPNDAEKVQLITNNNIKTENGQFEQANPSYEARLDTALDLRGKISSYTTIVDFDTVPFTISVAGQKQELAGQGPSVAYGAQYKVICSIGHGSSGNMQLSQEIAGARQIIAANPGKVEGRYILAGVVQLDIPNNTTRLALYFNGELLVEQTFAGLPTGTTHAAYTNFAIWDNRNGAYTQMYGAVHGAFLLDTALDDAQLKVLTAP